MLCFHVVGVGDDFTDATVQGISDSLVFVACLGPTFWERRNCMSELEFAYKKKKKLVFVLLPSHPPGDIHPSVEIMMGNSLYLDLRNLDVYNTELQDDFAHRVADVAAEARHD